MTEFVTANIINWNGKTYKAQPAPSEYNSCTGCAFRQHSMCLRPRSLGVYTCLPTVRADHKNIIWVEED